MRGRPPSLRIMLIDDHPIVRRGVRDILSDAYSAAIIEEVGSGGEATSLVRSQPWDMVILDLTLPDCSGLDVLKRIREMQERLPVLVLSMHAADQFARRAIAAGASGYLTKDAADAELVTAVSRLMRGGKYFGASVMEGVVHGLHPDHRERPHERLSDREYQVLRLLAAGKTTTEIASELSLSVKTVSTYRTRLLEKLNVRTTADLIRYALAQKLVE